MNPGHRILVSRLAFAAAILPPCAILSVANAAQTDENKPQTAAQKYKNIRVLKDLPATQLGPLMHQWNASLGVTCDFCHAVETNAAGQHVGWEKDVKPEKAMARKMVLMTQKINKGEKLLEGRATCFMCHHGRPNPETKAPEETPRGGK